jgi:chemotaxis protein MotB
MKTKFIPQLIILICSYMLLSACVSSKKYKDSQASNDQLKIQNQQLTKQNQDLNNDLAALKTTYSNYQVEYDKQKNDCQKAKSELDHIHAVMHDEENTLMQFKAKVYMALADFIDKGVYVEYKNGLLHVNMQDDLLFKTGNAEVGEKGKKALGSLARVLNDYPRLEVIVVGHTDTTMFSGKGKNNWNLSTDRAVSVIMVLRELYKIEPTRLTAAGKGKFDPIASNTTEEGKAKNRRTEIILKADLDRLWEETKLENQ